MENWIEQSALFRAHRKMIEEVNEHKWYLSEQAQCDCGWELAFEDWKLNHEREFITTFIPDITGS